MFSSLFNRFKKSETQKKSVNTGQEVDKVDKKRNDDAIYAIDLNTSALSKHQEDNTINRLENNPSYFGFSDDVTIGFNTDNKEHLNALRKLYTQNINPIPVKEFLSDKNVQKLLKDNNIEINYVENLKIDESMLLPFASTEVIFKNCEINSDILFEGNKLTFESCKFKDSTSIYSENQSCILNIIDCTLPEKIESNVTGNDRIKARERSLKIRGNFEEINIKAKEERNRLIGGLIDTDLATIKKDDNHNQIKFLNPYHNEMEPSVVLKLFEGSVIKARNLRNDVIKEQINIVKTKKNIAEEQEAYKECLLKEDEKKIRVMTQNKELKILTKSADSAIVKTNEIEDQKKNHTFMLTNIKNIKNELVKNNKYTWEELYQAQEDYYNYLNSSSADTTPPNNSTPSDTQGNTQGEGPQSGEQNNSQITQDSTSEAQEPVIETIGELTEESQQPDITINPDNDSNSRSLGEVREVTGEEGKQIIAALNDTIECLKAQQKASDDNKNVASNTTKTTYQKVEVYCKDATLTMEVNDTGNNDVQKYNCLNKTLKDIIRDLELDKKKKSGEIVSINIEIPLEFTNSTITYVTDDLKIYKEIMNFYKEVGLDGEGHLRTDYEFNIHLAFSASQKLYEVHEKRIYKEKAEESSENGSITSENNTTTGKKIERQSTLLEFKNGTNLYLDTDDADTFEFFNEYKNKNTSDVYLNQFDGFEKLSNRALSIDIEIPLNFRSKDGETVFTLITHDMETHNKIIDLYRKYSYSRIGDPKKGRKVSISDFLKQHKVKDFINNNENVKILVYLEFSDSYQLLQTGNVESYNKVIKLYEKHSRKEGNLISKKEFINTKEVKDFIRNVKNNVSLKIFRRIDTSDTNIIEEDKNGTTPRPSETKKIDNQDNKIHGEENSESGSDTTKTDEQSTQVEDKTQERQPVPTSADDDKTENKVSTPTETDVQPQRETETETENDALSEEKEFETKLEYSDAEVTFKVDHKEMVNYINGTTSKYQSFSMFVDELYPLAHKQNMDVEKYLKEKLHITSLNIKLPLKFNDETIIFYVNDIDKYTGIIEQYRSLKNARINVSTCNEFLATDQFKEYIKEEGIIYTISDDSSITMYLNDVIVKYQTLDLYGNDSLRRLSGDCFYIDLFNNKDWNSFSVKPTEILVPLEFEDENFYETILFKVGSYDIYKRLIDLYNTYSSNKGENLTSFDDFKNSSEVAEFIDNNMVTILDENNQNDTQILSSPDISTETKDDDSNTEQQEEETLQENDPSIQPLNGEYFDDNDIANGLYYDHDDDDFLRGKMSKNGKNSRERIEQRRLKGNL